MGLFDKLKKKEQQPAAQPKVDERPFPPQEITLHRSNDCVEVQMCSYYQNVLSTLQPGLVAVTLEKPRDNQPYEGFDGLIVVSNNCILGAIGEHKIKRYGFKSGYQTVCEVVYPQYRYEDHIQLYIRLTDDQKSAQKAKDDLKLWINLGASKWLIEDDERFDFNSGEILTRNVDGKKPIYIVIGDGRKLFEVNSRMKMYADIEQRVNYPIRRLIAERKDGQHGLYYNVGFYY